MEKRKLQSHTNNGPRPQGSLSSNGNELPKGKKNIPRNSISVPISGRRNEADIMTIAKLNNTIEQQGKSITDLKHKLVVSNKKIKQLNTDKTQISTLEEEIKHLKERIQEDIVNRVQETQDLTEKLIDEKREAVRIAEEYVTKKLTNKYKKEMIFQEQTLKNESMVEANTLEGKIQQLTTDLASAQEHIAYLIDYKSKINSEISSVKAANKRLQNEMSVATEEHSSLLSYRKVLKFITIQIYMDQFQRRKRMIKVHNDILHVIRMFVNENNKLIEEHSNHNDQILLKSINSDFHDYEEFTLQLLPRLKKGNKAAMIDAYEQLCALLPLITTAFKQNIQREGRATDNVRNFMFRNSELVNELSNTKEKLLLCEEKYNDTSNKLKKLQDEVNKAPMTSLDYLDAFLNETSNYDTKDNNNTSLFSSPSTHHKQTSSNTNVVLSPKHSMRVFSIEDASTQRIFRLEKIVSRLRLLLHANRREFVKFQTQVDSYPRVSSTEGGHKNKDKKHNKDKKKRRYSNVDEVHDGKKEDLEATISKLISDNDFIIEPKRHDENKKENDKERKEENNNGNEDEDEEKDNNKNDNNKNDTLPSIHGSSFHISDDDDDDDDDDNNNIIPVIPRSNLIQEMFKETERQLRIEQKEVKLAEKRIRKERKEFERNQKYSTSSSSVQKKPLAPTQPKKLGKTKVSDVRNRYNVVRKKPNRLEQLTTSYRKQH